MANPSEFEAFFRKADLDGDGQISGAEAVSFFQGSGLPTNVLAQIWTYADQRKAGYLSQQEFYNALKLVTVAQSKRELTPEIVKAALFGPAASKIPAPKINIASLSSKTPPSATLRPSLPSQIPPQNQMPRPSQFNSPANIPNASPAFPNQVAQRSWAGANFASPNPTQVAASIPPPTQVQPRPTGQIPAITSQPQIVSNEIKPKAATVNGFQSDSLFGDVFTATPIPPNQKSPPQSSSESTLPSSSAAITSAPPKASLSTVPPRPLAPQNHQTLLRPPHPSGIAPVRGSFSDQTQNPWPKMKPSEIQNYLKVFVQVDSDRDGKITGDEARNLFLSWRLPREILKQIWDLSDQDNDSMLSVREFCIAVYLMERYREGRPLPATLPVSLSSDETLLSATSHTHQSFVGGHVDSAAASVRPPQARPPSAAAPKPPRPPLPNLADDKPAGPQKVKMPVLEKTLIDQLSEEEQKSLNAKLQEVSEADKKVVELEKEITESRQKIDFFRTKIQELIIYKSRCDNRLNEISAQVTSDRHEVEGLASKYEEKCKQAGDVASRLSLEEATFRDIQEKKMDMYRAIVKLEEGSPDEEAIKERVERIHTGLEESMKMLNERCKLYGLRAVPTSILELPFGWQPGIQETAADLDEGWDKFEDEGFTFVKELTLDVQNVVASPKKKSSLIIDSTPKDERALSLEDSAANGPVKSPRESPKDQNAVKKDSLSHFTADDSSPRDKYHSTPVYDTRYAESVPGTPSYNTSIFADSVPSTPLYNQGKSPFMFDSVPSTPVYAQGKSPFAFTDSFPDTPSYDYGKSPFKYSDSVPESPAFGSGSSPFKFADSVPSSPAYSTRRFSDASDGFDAFDGRSFTRFDSMKSTGESDFGEHEPNRGFSRFDSFGGSDFNDDGFTRFDSFRESESGSGFPARFDSFRDSDGGNGFPSRFDSFASRDSGFSRFDSFGDSASTSVPKFDTSSSSRDFENKYNFSSFDDADPFGSGGPFKSSASAETETPKKGYDNWAF